MDFTAVVVGGGCVVVGSLVESIEVVSETSELTSGVTDTVGDNVDDSVDDSEEPVVAEVDDVDATLVVSAELEVPVSAVVVVAAELEVLLSAVVVVTSELAVIAFVIVVEASELAIDASVTEVVGAEIELLSSVIVVGAFELDVTGCGVVSCVGGLVDDASVESDSDTIRSRTIRVKSGTMLNSLIIEHTKSYTNLLSPIRIVAV